MIVHADVADSAYRIYVVEDSPIVLRLLLGLLGAITGVIVVGHSGHAEEAILEIAMTRPNAVLVDLMLLSGTGFDVLEAVAAQSPTPPVAMVLTNLTLSPYREMAERLGVAHFFDKSTEILSMIRIVQTLSEEHQQRSDPNRRR